MDVLLGCISAKFNQTNTRIHKTYLPILGYIWMNYDNAPTWNGQLGIVNPNQPWFGSWHHSDLWAMVKNSKTRHASFASFGNIHKPVTYYMFLPLMNWDAKQFFRINAQMPSCLVLIKSIHCWSGEIFESLEHRKTSLGLQNMVPPVTSILRGSDSSW